MSEKSSHTLYLGLGSNLGDKRRLIEEAVCLLNDRVGRVTRKSSLIETEPWGFSSPNKFLNGCVACQTQLSPREALRETQEIEREMGRSTKSHDGVYHDRPIDIDILLYDDWQINDTDLVVPHPKMKDRNFVMIPLREICPDLSWY